MTFFGSHTLHILVNSARLRDRLPRFLLRRRSGKPHPHHHHPNRPGLLFRPPRGGMRKRSPCGNPTGTRWGPAECARPVVTNRLHCRRPGAIVPIVTRHQTHTRGRRLIGCTLECFHPPPHMTECPEIAGPGPFCFFLPRGAFATRRYPGLFSPEISVR